MKALREIVLPAALSYQLAEIYTAMQLEYDQIAREIGQTCEGCPDNCCDSYFLHYTYAEWAYLWEGLHGLDPNTFEGIQSRSKEYVNASRIVLARGERPLLFHLHSCTWLHC